jgi:uncharacterized membrane protein YedE/YeeE
VKPYANPVLAGVALGLVLLASFVLARQGLGASGAFADLAARLPLADNAWVRAYRQGDAWMLVEVAGIVVGAGVSAALAGRLKPSSAGPARLGAAVAGGALMGVGAALARGCTSGLALSGGALLSVGAWAFMAALFLAGFLAAPLLRRLWP